MAAQFVSNRILSKQPKERWDGRPWHSNTQVRYLHLASMLNSTWKTEWSYCVYFAEEAQTHDTLGLVPRHYIYSSSCPRDPD